MSGYSKSRFIDLTDSDFEDLMCGICLGVFRDPIETSCCRKTYCKHCITEWIANNNTCPNDSKKLTQNDLIGSSKVVLKLLAKLKIKCEFSDNGCPQVVLLHALLKHTEECNYNECSNCGESMANIKSSDEHNCVHSLKLRVDQLLSRIKLLNETYQHINSKYIKLESGLQKHNIKFCFECGEVGHNDTQCTNITGSGSAQAIDRVANVVPNSTAVPYKRNHFREKQITGNTAETIVRESITATGGQHPKIQRRETKISNIAQSIAQILYHEASGQRADTYQQNKIIGETLTTPPSISEFDRYTVLCHDLNRTPNCATPLPPLKPDNEKYLFIEVPLRKDCVPKPYPSEYNDSWDSNYNVLMPCSAQNRVPGGHSYVSKWKKILDTFSHTKLKTAHDLVNAIKSYNVLIESVNFDCLLRVLEEYSQKIRMFDDFFPQLIDLTFFLPQLIDLTLRLPEIVTKPINLLRHNTNATIFLSQYQIACLLANAFFCTYPKRSEASVEYKDYPTINFISLFTNDNQYDSPKVQKLKCIINYFRRVIQHMPTGVVSFERRCLVSDEVPKWSQSRKALRKLNLCSDGLIAKDGTGLLQVVFANKLVGGGVLGSGCVQEEIRFAICPELIVSRLFTEKLHDNEVLIVNGCEQFNDYSGYGIKFEWKQDFVDNTPTDDWGRRYTTVVVMDALHFTNHQKNVQYCIKLVERELNKTYCGFFERTNIDASNKCAIASGNWGCGAFNGDPQLKAIIQLMAASQSDRDLLLFTSNDVGLQTILQRFYEFVVRNEFTVSHIYRALEYYDKYMTNTKITHKLGLIDYIMEFKGK